MRIRVTESQYSKIRLVTEQQEYVNKYKAFCAEREKEVTILYNKIVSETVGGILDLSIDIESLISKIEKIEREVDTQNSNMYNLWDQGLIDGDDNYDLVLNEISSPVSSKIDALSILLYALDKVQQYEKEGNRITKKFPDKPLDITGLNAPKLPEKI